MPEPTDPPSDAGRGRDLADRGHLPTEQRNPASADFDALDTAGIAAVINDADRGVPAAVRAALPRLVPVIDRVVEGMRHGGRLIYLGAGTSGRLGVLDASECPPTFDVDPSLVVGLIAGGDSALRRSSEGEEDKPHAFHAELDRLQLGEHDTVVGIAAGGTTPCVLGGLEHAKRSRAGTALIACVPLPERPHIDHCITLDTGPEVLTGSTRLKAGTATKLALNTLTTAAMVRLGKVYGHLMVDLRATNAKLRDRAARILMAELDLDRPAATELLQAADGRVKLALVMHRLDLDAAAANARLAETDGDLRRVIGPPKVH